MSDMVTAVDIDSAVEEFGAEDEVLSAESLGMACRESEIFNHLWWGGFSRIPAFDVFCLGVRMGYFIAKKRYKVHESN